VATVVVARVVPVVVIIIIPVILIALVVIVLLIVVDLVALMSWVSVAVSQAWGRSVRSRRGGGTNR
jgi:hypothetical protein